MQILTELLESIPHCGNNEQQAYLGQQLPYLYNNLAKLILSNYVNNMHEVDPKLI